MSCWRACSLVSICWSAPPVTLKPREGGWSRSRASLTPKPVAAPDSGIASSTLVRLSRQVDRSGGNRCSRSGITGRLSFRAAAASHSLTAPFRLDCIKQSCLSGASRCSDESSTRGLGHLVSESPRGDPAPPFLQSERAALCPRTDDDERVGSSYRSGRTDEAERCGRDRKLVQRVPPLLPRQSRPPTVPVPAANRPDQRASRPREESFANCSTMVSTLDRRVSKAIKGETAGRHVRLPSQ